MTCACCGKPKATIKPRKSSIISNVTLLCCEDCHNKKLEPRYLVVLVGRSKGMDAVRDLIVNHRYLGDEITAAELTV